MTATLVCLLLIAQVSPPPRNRGDQQKPAPQTDVNRAASPNISPVSVVNNQESTDEKQHGAKNNSKQRPEKPPWWDVAWATIALAIIGFAAALIAFLTLRDIKRQTKNTENAAIAARDSANAALQNAKALLNAERAWIDGEIVEAFASPQKLEAQIREGEKTEYSVKIVNHGRTPARITQWKMLADWQWIRVNKESTCHQETKSLHLLMGTGKSEILETFDLKSLAENWADVREGEQPVILKVIVEYFDIISGDETLHETSFVYVFGPSTVPERISKYNKYT